MAVGTYVGVNGVARKVKTQYVGVGGVARKVVKGYVGIGGVARKIWEENVSFTCTLTANFSTRFGQTYTSSCQLTFNSDGNGGYAAQGEIELQSYTTVCNSIYVTGVPANIQQAFSSVNINGETLSLNQGRYVGSGVFDTLNNSTAAITAKFTFGSGSGSGPV